MRFGAVSGLTRDRQRAPDTLIRKRQQLRFARVRSGSREPLIDRAEPLIRLQIVGLARAHRLERFLRTRIGLHPELRVPDQTQALDVPFEPSRFMCQEPQAPELACHAGPFDLFLEIERNRRQLGAGMGLELREQFEYRAVLILTCQRLAQRLCEPCDSAFEIIAVVNEIAIGQEVERYLVLGPGADQHRRTVAQAVADAQLVKRVRVVNGHVCNDELARHQQTKHVRPDAAGLGDLGRRSTEHLDIVLGLEPLERRPDQLGIDPLEIEAVLDVERSDNENAPHVEYPP